METLGYTALQSQTKMEPCVLTWDSLWTSTPKTDQQATPAFCLSCEAKFPDRPSLEEHICPFVSHICSCGLGFPDYSEMLAHKVSHNHTGSYIVNHFSAIQSRMRDVKMQEMKLKKLEGEVIASGVEQSPANHRAPVSITSCNGQTKNLSWRFKPVVKLETLRKFRGGKPYMCAQCQVTVKKQDDLIEHVNAHPQLNVYGCTRCGLLLLGYTHPPSVHKCGTFYAQPDTRYTTGKVLQDTLLVEKEKEIYPCPHCSLQLGHKLHLSNHIRVNHANLNKVHESSKITTSKNMEKRAQGTLEQRKQKEGHELHRRNCASAQKPQQQHKFAMPRTEALKQPDIHSRVLKRSSHPSLSERSCDALTFRFQASTNMKTYQPSIKTEPIELSVSEHETDIHKLLSVKSEPESNDNHGYAVDNATPKSNQLFYQSLYQSSLCLKHEYSCVPTPSI